MFLTYRAIRMRKLSFASSILNQKSSAELVKRKSVRVLFDPTWIHDPNCDTLKCDDPSSNCTNVTNRYSNYPKCDTTKCDDSICDGPSCDTPKMWHYKIWRSLMWRSVKKRSKFVETFVTSLIFLGYLWLHRSKIYEERHKRFNFRWKNRDSF